MSGADSIELPILVQAAEEFIETAITKYHDWRADEIVAVKCHACGNEDGQHEPGCPVPVLRAWLRAPAGKAAV
jgi:hypothetical protein